MEDYSFSWDAVNICSSPLLDRDPGRVGLPSMLLHPCQTTNINKWKYITKWDRNVVFESLFLQPFAKVKIIMRAQINLVCQRLPQGYSSPFKINTARNFSRQTNKQLQLHCKRFDICNWFPDGLNKPKTIRDMKFLYNVKH